MDEICDGVTSKAAKNEVQPCLGTEATLFRSLRMIAAMLCGLGLFACVSRKDGDNSPTLKSATPR